MQNGPNSWNNPRVLLTVALIFLCGALVGALAVTVTTPTTATVVPEVKVGDPNVGLTLGTLTRELNLTAEQQVRLQKVLDDYFQYYHALQDQLDEIKASGQDRILEILDEPQRDKFKQIMQEARQSGE